MANDLYLTLFKSNKCSDEIDTRRYEQKEEDRPDQAEMTAGQKFHGAIIEAMGTGGFVHGSKQNLRLLMAIFKSPGVARRCRTATDSARGYLVALV